MEGDDETFRQSSLPSSLIPHLYTRPQQLGDMLSGSGGTFRPPPRPSSPVTSGEVRISDESVGPPSTMALVAPTNPPFVQGRSSPRDYSPYGPMEPNMNRRSTGMTASVNFPMPGVRRAVDTQAMLPGGQRYNNPIYSDPSYHVSRPFIPYRGPGYAPPPYAQREGISRATWQGGEPGPSTVTNEGASRAQIIPHQVGHMNQTPSQAPEVFNRHGWIGEDLEAFQRSEVIQPRPSMVMPSARTYHGGLIKDAFFSKNTTLWKAGFYEAQASKLPPPQTLFPGAEAGPSAIYGRRHEVYVPPPRLTSASVAEKLEPSGEKASAEAGSSENRQAGKAEGNESGPAQQGRKSRRDSVEGDNSTRKAGSARKTAVACNFCRGTYVTLITRLGSRLWQGASCGATARDRCARTAARGSWNANMCLSSGGEGRGRRTGAGRGGGRAEGAAGPRAARGRRR